MDIFETVLAILEEEDLDCVILEEGIAAKTGMAGQHGSWTCNIELLALNEHLNALGALSRCVDFLVPEDRRPDVCVLLTMINYNAVPVGNFELDLEDGEVVFRTSVAFEDEDEVSPETVAHMLYLNWVEIDRFLPAIKAVVDGASYAEALESLSQES